MDIKQLLQCSEAFITRFPDGCNAVWKLLNIDEYETIRGLVNVGVFSEAQARLEAVRLAVFNYGAGHDLWPAGYADSLGWLILWYSGDCDAQTLRNDLYELKKLHTGNTPKEHMKKIVLAAYPSISPDDINKWTRPKLLKTFIQAEHSLFYRHGEAFEYLDPSVIVYENEKSEDPWVNLDEEMAVQKEEGITGATDFWFGEPETNEAANWHKNLTEDQLAALDRR